MDALVEGPWYLDHLAPVWEELGRPGVLWTRGKPSFDRAVELGLDPQPWCNQPGPLTLCAGFGDLRKAHAAGRRLVLMEHGAGQTYISNHPSYAGGTSEVRDAVEMFLVPGRTPAAKLRAGHPSTPVVEIGSPRLDRWHQHPHRIPADPPVVVVSFHWDCTVVPETRWVYPQFAQAVRLLARRDDITVMGHGHPRAISRLRGWYRRNSIPVIESFDEVLEVADCYVVDNSSTLFEAAAVGIPVVVMNSPRYRRNVEHGLRFWEASTIGPNADTPGLLLPAIRRALEQQPEDIAERERCLDIVYTHRDGTSARRAADAIRTLL